MQRQLPRPPASFVDRVPLVRSISEALDAGLTAGRPAFVAVHGASGVGVRTVIQKVYWDDEDRFPDGVFTVRLGDAVQENSEALGEALRSVLVELGAKHAELPASVEGLASRLWGMTYSLGIMLVLEGVTTAAQVKPFLLSSPRSAVVAMSRSPIRLLSSMGFGKQRMVKPLELRYGLELFERELGPRWWRTDDIRPEDVVRACGGYPLALVATIAQIRHTPEWELHDLLRRISVRGLKALDEEFQDFVLESLDSAYDGLTAELAREYRLLVGLHPGSTITPETAAVLLGCPSSVARSLLRSLAAAQFLTNDEPDVYGFHELMHWHAVRCVERDESYDARAGAARRIVEWFLDAAVLRDRVLSDRPRSGERFQRAAPDVPAPSREDALHWLEQHRTNLRAAVVLADKYRLDDLSWQLCEALWGLYHLHRHYDDWITTHRIGVAAAAHLGDARAGMRMSSQLGAALLNTNKPEEASAQFAESAEHARKAGDKVGQQSALEWSGKVAAARRRFDEAQRFYAQSWEVAKTVRPPTLRPRMFALLQLQQGRAHRAAGDPAQAVSLLTAAWEWFEGTGESDNKAKVLLERGTVLADLGRLEESAADARPAIALFKADRSLSGEAAAIRLLLRSLRGAERAEREQRLQEIYAIIGAPETDPPPR